jgi:uncharacterized damage-inducible protein DinB
MKELLLKYALYNVWANNLIIETLMGLDGEQSDREITSSFPSVRKTVCHVWSAEYIWWQRITLVEHPVWAESAFTGSLAEACQNWQDASAKLVAFVEKQFDDRALTHVFQYYDLKKNSHKSPVYLVLQHVFNHSTYHRGQLVTMLRQVGVKKIPQTDFIAYARSIIK